MNYAADQLTFTAWDMSDTAISLPLPLELEIVRSFDSPARSFEGLFPAARAWPELYRVGVYAGEQTLFEGAVDEQELTEDDAGRRLKLLARSKGALLLDNEALPQTYTNATLRDVFRNHGEPYGFQLSLGDNPMFNTYQVVKGLSEWEAISNFYRSSLYGHAFVDENDTVVCRLDEPPGTLHKFSNRAPGALRYASVKITNNRYAPVTRFVIRDWNGLYSYIYDNPSNGSLRLRRKRYLIPSPEFLVASNGGALEALLRARRSMLAKLVVTVTCPGLLMARVADRANVDTGLESFQGLFVQQVRHCLAAGGITTTLTLLNYEYL